MDEVDGVDTPQTVLTTRTPSVLKSIHSNKFILGQLQQNKSSKWRQSKYLNIIRPGLSPHQVLQMPQSTEFFLKRHNQRSLQEIVYKQHNHKNFHFFLKIKDSVKDEHQMMIHPVNDHFQLFCSLCIGILVFFSICKLICTSPPPAICNL